MTNGLTRLCNGYAWVSHLAVIAHSRLLPKDMHALLTFYLKHASTKRSTELKANDNISIRYSTLALKFSLFKHISIVFSRNSHQKPHTKIQDQWPFVTKASAAIFIILKWLTFCLSVNFPKCPAFMSNTKKYTQNNPVSFRKICKLRCLDLWWISVTDTKNASGTQIRKSWTSLV